MPLFDNGGPVDRFAEWLEQYLQRVGLEGWIRRYYGVYPGSVVQNIDPERSGRIQCVIPVVGGIKPYPVWVRPMLPGLSKGHGMVWVPSIGDQVWIQFENGLREKPIYSGGIPFAGTGLPSEGMPSSLRSVDSRSYGFVTPGGHTIKLVDTELAEQILIKHRNNAHVNIANDGTVQLMSKDGARVYLNATTGEIVLWGKTGERVVLGDGVVSVTSADGAQVSIAEDITILSGGKVNVQSAGAVNLVAGSVNIGAGPLYEALVTLTEFNLHTHASLGAPPTPPAIGTLNVKGS